MPFSGIAFLFVAATQKLLAVAFTSGSLPTKETVVDAYTNLQVFVGTGNCDGDDKRCVEGPPEPEQLIQSLTVGRNGSFKSSEGIGIPTGGAPVWLTTSGRDLQSGCIFATLANTSNIFAHGQQRSHSVPSGGVNPVYAAVTEDSRTLLVANYHGPDNANNSEGASVASFAIGSGCSLELVDVKNHSGSSVIPSRQGGAHVHSVVPVRGRLAYACDLGTDEIYTYSVEVGGKLTEKARTKVALGSGPRHLLQHPFKSYVYVVSEMGRSVAAYQEQPFGNGPLKLLQTESLVYSELGDGAGSKAAEIAISPDGKFVFATNRGSQNTVTVFEILQDGTLKRKVYVQAPAYPRGMALVSDGQVLLVGGQRKTEVWSYVVGIDGSLTLVEKSKSTDAKIDLPPHPATFATFEHYSPQTFVV